MLPSLPAVIPSGVVTEFTTGLNNSPFGITAGSDGNIWFTERSGDRVGRLTVGPSAATGAAVGIHSADATLAGSVTARSQPTTYHFDWGLTSAYGASTPETPQAARHRR